MWAKNYEGPLSEGFLAPALVQRGYKIIDGLQTGPVRMDVLAWEPGGISDFLANSVMKNVNFRRVAGNPPVFPVGCGIAIQYSRSCSAAYNMASLNAASCTAPHSTFAGGPISGTFDVLTIATLAGGVITSQGIDVKELEAKGLAKRETSVTVSCTGPTGSASYTYHVDIP